MAAQIQFKLKEEIIKRFGSQVGASYALRIDESRLSKLTSGSGVPN